MQKIRLIIVFLVFFVLPDICRASDLESVKIDFLQGNYRRVIFEGQAQLSQINSSNADELNYILGLSYFQESKLDLAQDCFWRILSKPSSKFKDQASLALADTYLVSGQFQKAEDGYSSLINDGSSHNLKSAILYRLSQLEFKKGASQQGNDYWFKLKKDFPLSPELRSAKGFVFLKTPATETGEYSIQLGFFTSSANANNFKDTLLHKNYPAYVESYGAGFKVKVGKFKLLKEALDLENKLSGEGFQTKICP